MLRPSPATGTMMTMQQTRHQQLVEVIRRANEIAASTELDDLLDRMLDLIIEVTHAESGTLYLYDAESAELLFKLVKGDAAATQLRGQRIPADRGVAGFALRQGKPLFFDDVANDPRWDRSAGTATGFLPSNMYCIPLHLRNTPVGLVQIFNLPATSIDDHDELVILELLSSRLVTEVEKVQMLAEARRRERRQQALVE